jgi:hypothetical protein
LATAAFLKITDETGFDLSDTERFLDVLLIPLESFSIVTTLENVNTEDTRNGVWWTVKHRLDGESGRTDGAIVQLYVEHSVAPAADVMNGAMPVIVALIVKCKVLDSKSLPRAISLEQDEEQLDLTLGFIRSQLHTLLR